MSLGATGDISGALSMVKSNSSSSSISSGQAGGTTNNINGGTGANASSGISGLSFQFMPQTSAVSPRMTITPRITTPSGLATPLFFNAGGEYTPYMTPNISGMTTTPKYGTQTSTNAAGSFALSPLKMGAPSSPSFPLGAPATVTGVSNIQGLNTKTSNVNGAGANSNNNTTNNANNSNNNTQNAKLTGNGASGTSQLGAMSVLRSGILSSNTGVNNSNNTNNNNTNNSNNTNSGKNASSSSLQSLGSPTAGNTGTNVNRNNTNNNNNVGNGNIGAIRKDVGLKQIPLRNASSTSSSSSMSSDTKLWLEHLSVSQMKSSQSLGYVCVLFLVFLFCLKTWLAFTITKKNVCKDRRKRLQLFFFLFVLDTYGNNETGKESTKQASKQTNKHTG